MFRRCLTRSRIFYSAAAAMLITVSAHADITMEERVTVSGAGMMKMANMSGRTVTSISGSKARTESDLQFESGMMRALARGAGQTTEIVRLDQDKMISVDNHKKTYTETTFEQRRAEMQKSMEQTEKSQASQQQATTGVDESDCEWSEPKGDVKKTGEKSTIAGYEAEHVTITATQSCKDKKTGAVCDFGLVLDEWVAPNYEAASEVQAYYKQYAEKLGLGTTGSRDFAERAQSMFGRYQGIWSEVASKMRDVKGQPVKSSFALGVGGPQCQSTQQQQQQQANSGSSSPNDLGSALGGALGGLFHKKKDNAPPPAETTPPPTLPGGLTPFMTVGTELISINKSAVDSASFEVPTGYKQAK
jgi:hypothetical protein